MTLLLPETQRTAYTEPVLAAVASAALPQGPVGGDLYQDGPSPGRLPPSSKSMQRFWRVVGQILPPALLAQGHEPGEKITLSLPRMPFRAFILPVASVPHPPTQSSVREPALYRVELPLYCTNGLILMFCLSSFSQHATQSTCPSSPLRTNDKSCKLAHPSHRCWDPR